MSKPRKDWHPADIKAALEKRGWTLARIARDHGYTCVTTPADALRRPYPVMEQIIAGIIGVAPREIWPSRYDRHGQPLGPRASKRADQADGRRRAA
jgi:Ner family transcriptional regulator